jgi:hypothetical protein
VGQVIYSSICKRARGIKIDAGTGENGSDRLGIDAVRARNGVCRVTES